MTKSRSPRGSAGQLYQILRQQLDDGLYGPGEKLPSVRELAEQYGVNKGTVVRVWSMLAHEGRIRTEAGRGAFVESARLEQKQIAVLFFDTLPSFRVDTEILAHIQRSMPSGYYLSLHDTSQNYQVFISKLEELAGSDHVHGFIAIPPKFYTPDAAEIAHLNRVIAGRPLVFVIRDIAGVHADFFSMDLDKGMRKAGHYLVALGKKRICLIKHDSHKFAEEGEQGLRAVCVAHRLRYEPALVLDYMEDIIGMEQQLRPLQGRIDALIAPDHMLCSLQGMLREWESECGNKLALIGINDIVSCFFYRALTSIRFPVEQIGRQAVSTLINRIEGRGTPMHIRENMVPEFIIRDT